MNGLRRLIDLVEAAHDPRTDPSFAAWFGSSLVVDHEGKPLVVYRGEHGASDTEFHTRLGSISFGSLGAASVYATQPNDDDWAESPRVIPAYLSIRKPVMASPDPYLEFTDCEAAIGFEKAAALFVDLDMWVRNTSNWEDNFEGLDSVAQVLESDPDRMRELYVVAYQVFDRPDFVALFKSAGYDGAIHGGNGETAGEIEFKIFSPGQARPAITSGGHAIGYTGGEDLYT